MPSNEHAITIVPDEAYLRAFWRAWLHAHGRNWFINLGMIIVFAVGSVIGGVWCFAADARHMLYVPAFMSLVAAFEGTKAYRKRRAWFAEARTRLTSKSAIRFVLRDGVLRQVTPEIGDKERLDAAVVTTQTPDGVVLRFTHNLPKPNPSTDLSGKHSSLFLPTSAWEPPLSSGELAKLLGP